MKASRRAMLMAASLIALAGSSQAQGQGKAEAKPQTALTRSVPAVRSTGVPQRDTLLALMRPIVVKFQDQRLEDVFAFIRETTGAEMDVMWQDDQNPTGLDKELKINLNCNGQPALTLIERVLQKADQTAGVNGASGSQWQMADSGEIQIGPKSRLNAFKRVEIYDVSDLITELPNYTDAPQFDLQSVLQSSQGGGGGQSPFQSSGQQNQSLTTKPVEQRLDETITLITRLVEPEQWENAGGDAATIQPYGKALIVNAPDYIHRELNGYNYWPDSANASAEGQVRQRRWVQFNGGFQASELQGFGTAPVTAVVPNGGG